jgi:hypothetical protein
MRSISAASTVIVVALSGAAAFDVSATAQLPAPDEGPVLRVQAQSSSKSTPKQRRRARRPAPSGGGSNPPPAGSGSSSQGFDPKKIWEGD